MNKKSLLVTLTTFTLVSCGSNGKMPKITEERAIELANEIIARQDDPQVFAQPKNFVYKFNGKSSYSELSPDGKTQTDTLETHILSFNLDKLARREYYKGVTPTGLSYEKETITYYDNEGVIRCLSNSNGYKVRTEESADANVAKSDFETYRNTWQNTYTWRTSDMLGGDPLPFALQSFSEEIGDYQALREELKNEKDQYCNLFVGSSGAKNLQASVEVKRKQPDESDYLGYLTYKYTTTIKNDLFASCTTSSSYNYKWNKDSHFFEKNNFSSSSSMTYGNATINIPNYMDYKLVEN